MARDVSLVVLRCRTSDRTEGGGRGAQALGEELGASFGIEPRVIGSPEPPRPDGHWRDDLRDSRGCLLEAGGQVADALAAGRYPILLASDCSICMTTFPAVAEAVPGVRFVWFDAHGDFNTPDTTPSHFLGGMCLAAACGRWETGLGVEPVIDPARVVQVGVRDVDGGERVELDRAGVGRAEPGQLASLVAGEKVFVHLDLDVLDPSVLPSQFPVPGGFSDGGLRTLLAELVGAAAEVVGCEITAFEYTPNRGDALLETMTSVVAPLVPPGHET